MRKKPESTKPSADPPIDLTGVELIGFSMRKKETSHIGLGAGGELDPMTATVTAKAQDISLALLLEAVEQLNQLFDGADFNDSDFIGFYTHLKGKTKENGKLATQISANNEQQFLASPDLKGSVVTVTDNFAGMTAEALGNEEKLLRLVELIGRALYRDEHAAA